MEHWVPLEKRSKKERRAYHKARRGSWNGVRPVTRILPDKKKEQSKRAARRWNNRNGPPVFGEKGRTPLLLAAFA